MREELFRIDCRGRVLDLRPGRAVVMGILNVTPDSFSDGGLFLDTDAAVRRAEEMLQEGAQVIDIGGESTRPKGTVYGEGATPVEAGEEIRRVIPVVERIAAELPEAIISVDTYKVDVAAAALAAGAHMVNDVTGLRHDAGLAAVVAERGAGLVVMHASGLPGSLPHEARRQDDVVNEVLAALRDSIATAENAGVESIIVDPGFGFGKSSTENLRLLAATRVLLELERPVMVGVSRKSTIGRVLGGGGEPIPASGRLYGSLGATAAAILLGASIVRTHDVRPTVEMLRVLTATTQAGADLLPSAPHREPATR